MNVNGQNLSMIRGDSETITISIANSAGAEIPLVTGDKIYFTIKQYASNTEKILQKIISIFDNGKAIIEIIPSDTNLLSFKKYVYDIQLTRLDTTVTTIVPTSTFEILEEVTHE